ncbi:MAG: ATP-binding protein, partial [Chloroflexota bacterium]
GMATNLTGRLDAVRRRQFVGRAAELELFRSALLAPELPFNVLYIFGPGGVGKTTLLNEFVRVGEQTYIPVTYLDARAIEPSPESLLGALRLALDLPQSESPLAVLAARANPHVIVLDTVETLAPLDQWMLDVFLPSLPENVLLVLAGRNPPPSAWRTDAAWQTLIRVLPLRNLSPQESRAFLSKRTVPSDEHQAVLDFTHGHPLALSLVADVFDQRPQVRFQPEAEPDIIRILLEQFVQKVPGPAHRAALEACALVRVTTEGLLRELLNMPDPHELFDWLRDLSFIETSRDGLFPHDLAREALAADVRWRNPDWYAELHNRARAYYAARLGQGNAQAQQRVLLDYLFLHRDNPVVRPFFEWQSSGTLLADAMRESDVPLLLAMVEKHEGAESARLAAHWFETQSRGVTVIRDVEHKPAGFMAHVNLQQVLNDDLAAYGAAQSAWRYLQRHAPLRSGESALLFRYWMARDAYQSVSPVQSLVFVNAVRQYLTTPGLAFTFFPCADPDFWAAVFAYGDLMRIPEADFEVGGRRYGMYGHDWRKVPTMAWLDLLAKRELDSEMQTTQPTAEPLIVLSEAAFTEAVQDALRDFTRPDALHANPLTRSRPIVEQVGANATAAKRTTALQNLLRSAAESLQRAPREAKLYRAVQQTYFDPAPTQEQAAERLDLPFSTYRRHLKSGVTRIVEMLWMKEIGA